MNADGDARAQRLGLIYGLAAYAWWGFIPLYFKLVAHVPALTVLAHRVVWSTAFLAVMVAAQRRWGEVAEVVRRRQTLGLLALGAVLIAVNWLTFIHAVSSGQVMQASLGYYITPLVCVLLGLVVLRERMRPLQWTAVGLAAAGVAIMATAGDSFPWVALLLAWSFGLYALTRKYLSVGPMIAVLMETALLLPLGLAYVIAAPRLDGDRLDGGTYGLLMLAGAVTALPLLWFANAVRRLRLSTMGFMQYLAPTLQLLCALMLGEAMGRQRLVSFTMIWVALAIFTLDALRAHRAGASITSGVELAD